LYKRSKKDNRNTKKILWFQVFILTTLFTVTGMARADATTYDKNYNVQGYKKVSDGVVSVYDKHWNRTGY